MTITSRRKDRYMRRNADRAFRRQKAIGQCDSIEHLLDYSTLYKAAKQAAKGVRWKESVQRYMINACINLANTRKKIMKKQNLCMGFIEFDLCERGKLRHIKSVHFFERVIQKALCTNVLGPVLTYNLVYTNSASQKGKGTHFAVNQLVKQLRRHIRHHGREGHILLIDFKGYFENIAHEPLKQSVREYFTDPDLLRIIDEFIDAFGDKGLGLGSETSQTHAIAYLNKIDHYIVEQENKGPYGRYMDDSYLVALDRQELEQVLSRLKKQYDALSITVSPKKTFITDLKHGFTFLKTRISITEDGIILKKPCRDSITRERKKLKKQMQLLDKGEITEEQINTSYTSWTGSMKHRKARRTVHNMDKLRKQLLQQHKEKKQ